jgi:biopolymer transport protein TolR
VGERAYHRSMGMSSGGTKEINITPLIDVLLVLLIIFLVMMPIMMRMETVDVPPKNADVIPPPDPVVLKINADFSVTIDDIETIGATDLAAKIGNRVRASKQVFIDFGDGVPWSEVLHTVDLLRGFSDEPEAIKVAVRVREDQAP